MPRLLDRIERRWGRYALGNLTYYLVGLQILGFILVATRPDALQQMFFDPQRITHGEPWRALTWLAIPVSSSPLWFVFAVFWLYSMGTSLEAHWGPFRYQLYWLVGIGATIAIAAATGVPAGNGPLIMSLFLAFATLFPDYELRLFFLLPVPVKYLALLDGAYILYQVGTFDGWAKLMPLLAIANYLLFFSVDLLQLVRGGARQAGRARALGRYRQEAATAPPVARSCAVCGVTDADPEVEFRVCDCERCGGKLRNLCLAHARNH